MQTSKKNEPKKVTVKFIKNEKKYSKHLLQNSLKKFLKSYCYKIILKKNFKKLFLTLKAKKQTIFIF